MPAALPGSYQLAHRQVHQSQVVFGIDVALLGSFGKSLRGLRVVLLDTMTVQIKQAQIVLSIPMSLVCQLLECLRRRCRVYGHSISQSLHHYQVVLGVLIALLGSFGKLLRCCFGICLDALAFGTHDAKTKLRVGVPCSASGLN